MVDVVVAALKLTLEPAHIVEGVAVAEDITGNAFTTTFAVVAKVEQPPSTAVAV